MTISLCDNCTVKGCLWKAETGTLDPPIMDCEDFEQRITNADKIRAMTDEELAEYFHSLEWGRFPLTKLKWLDWLEQETNND